MVALGYDIGTTAVKTVLVNEDGQVIGVTSKEQHQFFPKPGWCEQDADELLSICIQNAADLISSSKIDKSEVMCLGMDHQGETCLVWDKATGKPLYNAITWQDRRMAAASQEFGKDNGEKIQTLTGLRSDSYYSAWKIRWLLDNIPDGQKRAENGELLAGTLNTYFIWQLTGHKSFVTDEGSSDVMMLCDPRKTGWNEWLLKVMNIPVCMLPEIRPCNDVLGVTDPATFLGLSIPITCSLPDCSAGIVGSGAIGVGDMTVTYGTGNFMHLITGSTYVPAANGLTSACSFATTDRKNYQLNGIGYTAGAAVKWLCTSVGLIESAKETEALARSVKDTGGVYFVPALNGLATPTWDQSARGALLGMTAATTKAHIVRAVLESSALQVAKCCQIMQKTSPVAPKKIFAVGGMTANAFLMQLESDLCGIPVCLPSQTEPAYGSAIMAMYGLGKGPGIDGLSAINAPVKTYEPHMSREESEIKIANWFDAVSRTLNWNPIE
ncbi:MAG: hypothetical protein MJ057_08570 [Sphaerochaetaceae bacterium]|nr:hypothetical protein [Sphaerochaetaceae bacterium]